MKRTFTTTITLALGIALFAQNQSNAEVKGGTVYYDQVVKLDIKLDGDNAQFANALPKEQRSKKILYFNNESALYENNKEDNAEADFMDESQGMVIKVKQSEDIIYTDLEKKNRTEQREFMTRLFLIEEELGDTKWKLTGNQKKVLDYACQEAIMEKVDKKITAWFTPSIAVPFGPGKYGGLPGLILEIMVNDNDLAFVATAVDTKAVEKNVLEKPTKGKKVSAEEFKTIVDEKMKEMGAEGGEGGVHEIMIKIN